MCILKKEYMEKLEIQNKRYFDKSLLYYIENPEKVLTGSVSVVRFCGNNKFNVEYCSFTIDFNSLH